MRAEYTVKT